MQSFSELSLAQPIQTALTEEGYTTPTPIQALAIPPVLEGRDVLGLAQTGTGKTAAFALPIIHRLLSAKPDKSRRGPRSPRALILSPTRELATQIAESFKSYGRHSGLRGCIIFGGVKQFRQVRQLQSGVDIIVATPGRLMDLMHQGYVDLRSIEVFTLDEADRMLDMGFIEPIRRIAEDLPEERQSLMFSATMAPPIAKLASSLLRDPVRVEVAPAERTELRIEQSLHMVSGKDKPALLEQMLADEAVRRAVVFTRTKRGADSLSKRLVQSGVSAESIHGNKSQGQRDRALDAFRAGRARVLVATDVAARGLDVDGITHVFNFHLPNEPEAYVHRIGRTGRAGAAGVAVSFCDPDERAYLRAIEKFTGQRIGPERPDHRERESKPRAAQMGNRASAPSKPRSKRRPGKPASSAHGGQTSHNNTPHRPGGKRKARNKGGARTGGSASRG